MSMVYGTIVFSPLAPRFHICPRNVSISPSSSQRTSRLLATRRLPGVSMSMSTTVPKEPARELLPTKEAFGYAARDTSGVLSPFDFSRRATGEEDVDIKILYCGICHTDLHLVKNDWGSSQYPLVPGHEIIGVVTEVGSKANKFKVGDKVGVGYYARSCEACDDCAKLRESYCPKLIPTCNAMDHDGSVTYGGFADRIVVKERYVHRVPESIPLEKAGPLLCAGITVYSPLKYYGLTEPGMNVGIVGLGGLGHLAVKFAKAFGLRVTVISTSPAKEKEAIERLGVDAFLVSRDAGQMKAAVSTFDAIVDTVSSKHQLTPLLGLLKSHGKLVMLGAPGEPLEISVFPLLLGRKLIGGSNTGGTAETQEMLDFAGDHGVTPDVEVVPVAYMNEAMQRLAKGDVKYRFVLDVANTLRP